MKTSRSRTVVIACAILGLFAADLHAQIPAPTAPTKLADALSLKGGKIVAFQPYQMKRGQTLLLTHTAFKAPVFKPGVEQGALFVVYSTDEGADYGTVLYQDFYIPTAAGPGGGPHIKVFDGFTPEADQKGIIAILIGLLRSPTTGETRWVPLPSQDSISAEIHDGTTAIGLLLPAVQKIREAAAR